MYYILLYYILQYIYNLLGVAQASQRIYHAIVCEHERQDRLHNLYAYMYKLDR